MSEKIMRKQGEHKLIYQSFLLPTDAQENLFYISIKIYMKIYIKITQFQNVSV